MLNNSPQIFQGNNNINNNSNTNINIGSLSVDNYNNYQFIALCDDGYINNIIISCRNIYNRKNIKYSCKITSDEIKNVFCCANIFDFINQMKENLKKSNIQKEEDYLLLFISFGRNNEMKVLKLIEEIEINTLKDAANIIKKLMNENKKLKNEIDSLKNKSKNFEEYMNKMNLNCFYNSFDMNSFNLEKIFSNFNNNNIIQKREELGLINSGIKNLFNSNITSMICKYKTDNLDINVLELKNLYSNNSFLITVILTKDNRKFGAFSKNAIQVNNNINMMNQNMNNNGLINHNNMMNQMMMNPMTMNQNMNNNGLINQNNMMNQMMMNPMMMNQNMNNNGMMNQNNMMMNQNNMNNNSAPPLKAGINTTNGNEIFVSNLSWDNAFVFSLDDLKIEYYNEENLNKNESIFSILYDMNRQCLYGIESINSKDNSTPINSDNLTNNSSQILNMKIYKLSGKKEFNIKKYEIYTIEISRI